MLRDWIDRLFRDEEVAPPPTLVECLRQLYDIEDASARHEPAPQHVNTDIYHSNRDTSVPHRRQRRRPAA